MRHPDQVDGHLTVRQHRSLVRDGAQIIIASVIVAVLLAVAVSAVLPRSWAATATLYVGQSLTEPGFDYGGLLASQLLTPTYVRLATSADLLQEVADDLGIAEATDQLAQRIEASAPPGATLITLRAVAGSPEDAVALTDAVADALVLRAPAEREDQSELEDSLASVDAEIETTRQALIDLLARPSLTAAQQDQVNQLQQRLQAMEATRDSLAAELATRSPNALTIVERARTPTSPAGPSRTIIVASAGAAAFGVAALFVYAFGTLRRPRTPSAEPA